MGKTVVFCNQKGGVGKTTTAINLSAYAADKGRKILLIDFDPQANATSGLGLDKRALEKSVYEFIGGQAGFDECLVCTSIPNLFLLPSRVALTGLEVELVEMPQREFVLSRALEPIKEKFDFIFIDCPPSLGLLTLNALVAADSLIIPLQCEYYALEGLSQLMETVSLIKKSLNPGLKIEGVVLTMADFRTRLTAEVIKEVRQYFPEKVFESVIPRNIRLGESPGFGQPILVYDRASLGAIKYESFTEEFLRRQPRPGPTPENLSPALESESGPVSG